METVQAPMEPWHFSHGEVEQLKGIWSCMPAASMEPWHFSHGEGGLAGLAALDRKASMEPWHFSHGEVSNDPETGFVKVGFNGAMAF